MHMYPPSVYRYALFGLSGLLLLFGIHSIFSYDDEFNEPVQSAQTDLRSSVSGDSSRSGTPAPKRILMWTTIYGGYKSNVLTDCTGLTDRCAYVSDRSLISSADAVLFHSQDIAGTPFPNPAMRKPSQRYVYLTMETPWNSGSHRTLTSLPKNYFNWTATHLGSSDVLFKYGPFWISAKEAEQRGFKKESFVVAPERLVKPEKGIFGLISNCHTTVRREDAIAALAKYIPVTIGGKCAKTSSLRRICSLDDDCQPVFERYPFFLAIENSLCQDYITEKYWSRFKFASIPIVMRRSIFASSNAPPKSFIAMDDYASPKEMADHLNMLQSNKTAYAEYFNWRNSGQWTVVPWNSPGFRNTWCALCEKLWETNQTNHVVDDVYSWFEKESACERDEFVTSWLGKEDRTWNWFDLFGNIFS